MSELLWWTGAAAWALAAFVALLYVLEFLRNFARAVSWCLWLGKLTVLNGAKANWFHLPRLVAKTTWRFWRDGIGEEWTSNGELWGGRWTGIGTGKVWPQAQKTEES